MGQFTRTKELLVTPPAVEPVSLNQVKPHCYIALEDTSHDETLSDLIVMARQHLEKICWSSFITQTWDYWWDRYWWKMFIPRPPLLTVTTFQYVPPGGGALRDVGSTIWELSAENQCPFARLKYLQTWPITRGFRDDVYMRVTSGYGPLPSDVPMPIRHAIKLLAAFMFLHRGDELESNPSGSGIAMGLDSLIASYRFKEF